MCRVHCSWQKWVGGQGFTAGSGATTAGVGVESRSFFTWFATPMWS